MFSPAVRVCFDLRSKIIKFKYVKIQKSTERPGYGSRMQWGVEEEDRKGKKEEREKKKKKATTKKKMVMKEEEKEEEEEEEEEKEK